jgi:hypothetical protein
MGELSKRYKSIGSLVAVLFVATVSNPPVTRTEAIPQIDYAWDMMCGGKLRPIARKLKQHQPGKPAILTESIQPCTKHVYEFSGEAGQQFKATLGESQDTWILLSKKRQNGHFPPTRNWDGRLPEKGKYLLTVVTVRQATYTLRFEFQ